MIPEVEKLNKQIQKLQTKVKDIQDKCPHINHKSKNEANTGNWDPNDNSYWVIVNCLDCGKYIHFDSEDEPEQYRKYSR